MNVDLTKDEVALLIGVMKTVENSYSNLLYDARWRKLCDKLSDALSMTETGRFVLHDDGEDECRTEELHKFLADVEFEGDEWGITLWPNWPTHVRIGDTIIKRACATTGYTVYDVERR